MFVWSANNNSEKEKNTYYKDNIKESIIKNLVPQKVKLVRVSK